MTRPVLVPTCLALAAAVAFSVVFVVHGIERRVGPFALPYAARHFAPNSDGEHRTATIRFATEQDEQVTLRIRNEDGDVVRTLLDDEHVDGGTTLKWDGDDDDGDAMPDGSYTVELTRSGDRRVYAPVNAIRVDRTEPRGWLENLQYIDGVLTGLVVFDPDSNVVVENARGDRLDDLERWRPNPNSITGTPVRTPFDGARVIRFRVPVDAEDGALAGVRVALVDMAGNRVDITQPHLERLVDRLGALQPEAAR